MSDKEILSQVKKIPKKKYCKPNCKSHPFEELVIDMVGLDPKNVSKVLDIFFIRGGSKW